MGRGKGFCFGLFSCFILMMYVSQILAFSFIVLPLSAHKCCVFSPVLSNTFLFYNDSEGQKMKTVCEYSLSFLVLGENLCLLNHFSGQRFKRRNNNFGRVQNVFCSYRDVKLFSRVFASHSFCVSVNCLEFYESIPRTWDQVICDFNFSCCVNIMTSKQMK